MTRNYPGRLHIPVCIIPCARYSTANRLVFHSASRQPLLPHYQGPQPRHAHHRLSTQRQQSPPDSHSIRSTDSGYSGTSAPPSAKPHPLHLDTSLMNPGVSRAASTSASTTRVDHSIAGSGSGSRRSPTPPAPYLVSVATARCRCRTAPGQCPLPLPHTPISRSKIMVTPLFHVVELHLVNMGHQLRIRCILTARPLCTRPSLLASPKPSVHA